MRDSLVIYRSTVEAGNTLSEKQRLKFYESLFNYALDDVEPEGLNGTMKIFFELTVDGFFVFSLRLLNFAGLGQGKLRDQRTGQLVDKRRAQDNGADLFAVGR